jgi:hypothetical protein
MAGVLIDNGHTNVTYPSFAGTILAFPDGTVTNSLWKCSNTTPGDSDGTKWNTQAYDDTAWSNALEIDPGCCPWRDPNRVWTALNAKWIWTTRPSKDVTAYCRFSKKKHDSPNN